MKDIKSFKNQQKATAIFETIENYKDAKILKNESIKKTRIAKQIQIAIISAIVGKIIFFMCIMATEFIISIPVFLETFVISELCLQVYWNKLIK